MLAETKSRVHESYCLLRADVAFFHGDSQLADTLWSTAGLAEIRFRGLKGDQLRKGACCLACGRVLRGPWGPGGGAVDLMIDLMSSYLFVPSSARYR